MAENEGFEDGDQMGHAGTFSQLLFSDDRVVGLDLDQSTAFTFSSSANVKPPKMLCFGTEQVLFPVAEAKRTSRITHQRSGLTCSDSSSTSSINNAIPKSHQKKRNGSAQCRSTVTAAPRNCKKNRTDNPAPTKARKEKLGERIAALQQLVSPFGKTDTASVLHEAMGYIRFLQDQVQVLCSPYLQRLPSSAHHNQPEGGGWKDLRSRGLCLVPVECTVLVDNTNGADFWSPAMGNSGMSAVTKP